MQEPQAPSWNPNLPRWAVQDIDRYINNGIQNYPDVLKVVNSVGGVGAYRQMAADFEKADALYQINHAKWQLEQAKARGSNATSGNENWLGYYYDQAAKTGSFSEPERANFAQQAEETKKQAAANKIIEDRNAMLRTAADKVQGRLLNEIWPARNAEYDRIYAETDALRKQVDAAYNNDIEQALKLYSAGMMAPAEYKELTEKLRSNYATARDQLTAQYKQARAAVSQIADQQSSFVDSLVADIQKGNYDPETEYKLPDFGYKPMSLSASYTPVYAAQPKEEEPQQPQQPGSTPVTKPSTEQPIDSSQPSAPTKPPATTPTAPTTPPASGNQSAGGQPSAPPPPQKIDTPAPPKVVRAPRRESSDLVGRARVVDQNGQSNAAQKVAPAAAVVTAPQQPGLIGGAGLLAYTPTMNAPANNVGLLLNQNPQLYNLNASGVRLPGQGV